MARNSDVRHSLLHERIVKGCCVVCLLRWLFSFVFVLFLNDLFFAFCFLAFAMLWVRKQWFLERWRFLELEVGYVVEQLEEILGVRGLPKLGLRAQSTEEWLRVQKLSCCAQVSRIGPNRQCRAGTRPWGWWLLRFQCRHLCVSQLDLEESPDRSTGSGARRGQAELCASSSWDSCRHSAPMVDKAGQRMRSIERTVRRWRQRSSRLVKRSLQPNRTVTQRKRP